MYYDRTIDEPLALTIAPAAPLSWLMDHVRSGEGAARFAHVQFRRNRSARRRGGIQLYWRRTSPLEFRLRRDGQVSLHAHRNRDLSNRLFAEPVAIDRLRARADDSHDHLERSWKVLSDPSSSERRRALRRLAGALVERVRRLRQRTARRACGPGVHPPRRRRPKLVPHP